MFLGEYSHALDSKKRIFMPAKYREELGETFVITKSVDKCLTVYTLPEWEKLKASKVGMVGYLIDDIEKMAPIPQPKQDIICFISCFIFY